MATSPNFNWPEPDNTDLVKNGALAIRTAVNAIDSSLVDLKGGTTGQVLAKASGTDMDFAWVAQDDANAIQNTQLTAKGALISAFSSATPATLTVGSNGQVLTADSTTATGLKWETPAAGGGGKVLQVVNGTTITQVNSSTSSFVDTGLTATITPSSATSKILVLVSQNGISKTGSDSTTGASVQLLRGASVLNTLGRYVAQSGNTNRSSVGGVSASFLDSPATTSATTYKTQFCSSSNAASVSVQYEAEMSYITLLEIGA